MEIIIKAGQKVMMTCEFPSSTKNLKAKMNRFRVLQDRARDFLVAQGEDPETVQVAIGMLDERAADLGKTPASAQYYVACFESLKANDEEWSIVRSKAVKQKTLREKFMPNFTGNLTPEMEKRRSRFNSQIASAEITTIDKKFRRAAAG